LGLNVSTIDGVTAGGGESTIVDVVGVATVVEGAAVVVVDELVVVVVDELVVVVVDELVVVVDDVVAGATVVDVVVVVVVVVEVANRASPFCVTVINLSPDSLSPILDRPVLESGSACQETAPSRDTRTR